MDIFKIWTSLFVLIESRIIVWGNNEVNTETLTATITSLVVTSDIKYRYATTKFSTSYINPYALPITATFYVNLPNRAYISNFTMNINGIVTVGQVKEKEEAECIYEATVSSGQSAGIVKHRFTNVFDINVNIEPNATAVFDLIYQELLQRIQGKYSHVIYLTNQEVISNFLVEVFIKEPQEIIDLVVPQIRSDLLVANENEIKVLETASVEYISNKEIYIKYEPTIQEQKKINESGITGLFKVLYDVNRGSNPNMLYAIDGYFVHFFAPDLYKKMAKNIVFMLDISGSMSGHKLKQLKQAMVSILNSLQPDDDSFFLGFFSDDISWMNEKELWPASKTNISYAIKYVQELKIEGSTNIYDALMQSVSKLNSLESQEKKNLIFFLTDGQATSGVTDTKLIRKAVRTANKDISLIALGFGENCDFKFLKLLASENGGFSRKIYFAADSQLQIANLYNEISNILLKDIQITYLDSAVNTQELTNTYFDNYIDGSELVVSGPLSKDVGPEIKVVIQLISRSGPQNQTLKLRLDNVDFEIVNMPDDPNLTSLMSLKTITRNTWLYLTLKKLLSKETTHEIKRRIVTLGVKYGFVTPLTSMVVTDINATQCTTTDRKLEKGFIFSRKYASSDFYNSGSRLFPFVFSWLSLSISLLVSK